MHCDTHHLNRNYLRVRGEYFCSETLHMLWGELPPRARRIHLNANWVATIEGTTSACAENTSDRRVSRSDSRNYLRVRGEYHKPGWYIAYGWELPPRARRILIDD